MEKKENMRVYQFRNETGEGTITIYEVFPGVTLAYNDFHMSYYDSEYQPGRDMFCIDHCREGRLEYPAGNGTYSYVEVGDIKLDRRISHVERFEMPLSHYHGAMVAVDMKIAEKSIHEEKPYFYKAQVEKTKALKVFLTEHIEENYTQEQLAKQFGIPITAMKKCFKSIYGMPIGNWLMQYRMNYAAERLLADSRVSIAELAGEVGYDSPSKFAIAFRKIMGMSPTEYRNRKIS